MNNLKIFGEGTIWKVDAEGNQASEKITSKNIILDKGLDEMKERIWANFGLFSNARIGTGTASNFIHNPSAIVTDQNVESEKTVIEVSNFTEEGLVLENKQFWVIVFEGGEVAKIISVDVNSQKITLSKELQNSVLSQKYTLWDVRRVGLQTQVQNTETKFSGPSTSGSGNTAQITTTYEFPSWGGADNTLITEAAVSASSSIGDSICRVVFNTPTVLNTNEKIRFTYVLNVQFDSSFNIVPINISGWGEHEGSYLGDHTLLEDLEIAHPSPSPSDYAYVDGVLMRYYDSSWTTSGAHLPLYAEVSNPRPNPLSSRAASPYRYNKEIHLSSSENDLGFSPTGELINIPNTLASRTNILGSTVTPSDDSSLLDCYMDVGTTFDTTQGVGNVRNIYGGKGACHLKLREQDLPNNPSSFRQTFRVKLSTHRLSVTFRTYWSTAFPNLPN